jgi:chromosomal replication initiation ATPase DnaA
MEELTKIKRDNYIEIERLKVEVKVHINQVAFLSNQIKKLNKSLNLPKKQDVEVADELIKSMCICLRQSKAWPDYEELNIDVIKGKSRLAGVSSARHAMVYVLRKHLRMSYKSIGNVLNRDHATMMHSVKVVENCIDVHNRSNSYTDQTLTHLNEIHNYLGFN